MRDVKARFHLKYKTVLFQAYKSIVSFFQHFENYPIASHVQMPDGGASPIPKKIGASGKNPRRHERKIASISIRNRLLRARAQQIPDVHSVADGDIDDRRVHD